MGDRGALKDVKVPFVVYIYILINQKDEPKIKVHIINTITEIRACCYAKMTN